jgi:5-formyltetrahydrofolate cyclo-ligase
MHRLALCRRLRLQEVPTVPRDDTDQPLDWIVTEREAIAITRRTVGD